MDMLAELLDDYSHLRGGAECEARTASRDALVDHVRRQWGLMRQACEQLLLIEAGKRCTYCGSHRHEKGSGCPVALARAALGKRGA